MFFKSTIYNTFNLYLNFLHETSQFITPFPSGLNLMNTHFPLCIM